LPYPSSHSHDIVEDNGGDGGITKEIGSVSEGASFIVFHLLLLSHLVSIGKAEGIDVGLVFQISWSRWNELPQQRHRLWDQNSTATVNKLNSLVIGNRMT
jgi:hypothetical protein